MDVSARLGPDCGPNGGERDSSRGVFSCAPQARQPVRRVGAVNKAFTHWLMKPNEPDWPSLLELFALPRWMADAACRGLGHHEYVISVRHTPSEAVLATCADCPVHEECLAYALAQPDLVGVWGGTTERERRKIRRQVA